MSTRKERAAKRRQWVKAAGGRSGLVPRCRNCGEAGPHFVPPSLGDPGFYACERREIGAPPTPPHDPDCECREYPGTTCTGTRRHPAPTEEHQ